VGVSTNGGLTQPSASKRGPPLHDWLRSYQGRCHRLVLLNQLPQHQEYNGLWGWADVEQLEQCAHDSQRLVPVVLCEVDNPRTIRVQARYLFLAGPLLTPAHEVHPLVVIEVALAPP